VEKLGAAACEGLANITRDPTRVWAASQDSETMGYYDSLLLTSQSRLQQEKSPQVALVITETRFEFDSGQAPHSDSATAAACRGSNCIGREAASAL
jgi:hypothetical protein